MEDDKLNIPNENVNEIENDKDEIENNDSSPSKNSEDKLNTGRIPTPTPTPMEIDTSMTPMDAPISSDTIEIKRPQEDNDKRISLEDETAEPKKLKIFCYKCEQKLDLTNMKPFSTLECPSCNSSIIVPMWFDNYLLEEVAGVGGMAKVYRGLDLALDREIAVKILNKDLSNTEEQSKLFLHEARTAATLNHFALLPIYTCGEYENQSYFVMQFMGGGSLEQEINNLDKDDTIAIPKIIRWMIDAAEGLDNARRHGIIHHDVKPGNFLLDNDDALKIGDFGISQALFDSRSEEINELTEMWASPDYVSPEKISTKKETYLGDIYSLGATFYHVLTGHPPFESYSVEELLKSKTVRDPLDIRKLRDDIPEGLSALIMSMLSRTPEARPSYRDIIAELNSLKGNKFPQRNTTANTKKRSANQKKQPANRTNTPVKKMRTTPNSHRKIRTKSSLPSQIMTLLFLLALCGGGYYLWDNGYLDQFFSDKEEKTPRAMDYLQDVTKQLASGNSGIALKLADAGLNSISLETNGKEQAALQLALATYLQNSTNAINKCSLILERLKASDENINDHVLIILRYLSAGSIPPTKLRNQLNIDKKLKLVGEIAIFLKEVYNKGDDSHIREAYRNYSSNVDNINSTFWGKASFVDRVPLWYNWIFMGKKTLTLEPLINLAHRDEFKSTQKVSITPKPKIKKRVVTKLKEIIQKKPRIKSVKSNSGLSLNVLSHQWLKEHRAFAFLRPKPNDFTFDNSTIKTYLNNIPKQYRKIEAERANQITPLKHHLCAIMLHMAYGRTTVKRRKGRPVTGTIMANKNYVSVRSGGNKRVRIKWEELHFDQFIKFLDHYAKLRGESNAGSNVSKSKQKREAAWEYLRIAILCDWYGKYRDAVKYTLKAVAKDPGIKDDAITYMMK